MGPFVSIIYNKKALANTNLLLRHQSISALVFHVGLHDCRQLIYIPEIKEYNSNSSIHSSLLI